jgi:hypothetical protein
MRMACDGQHTIVAKALRWHRKCAWLDGERSTLHLNQLPAQSGTLEVAFNDVPDTGEALLRIQDRLSVETGCLGVGRGELKFAQGQPTISELLVPEGPIRDGRTIRDKLALPGLPAVLSSPVQDADNIVRPLR